MKIKTYLVRSLSDAVEKIKKEMGPEAVILSTRKVDAETHPLAAPHLRLEVTAALYTMEESQETVQTGVQETVAAASAFQEAALQVPKTKQSSVASEPSLLADSALPQEPKMVERSPIQDYFAKQNQEKIEKMEAAILSVCEKLSGHEVQVSLIQELSEYLVNQDDFDLEKCEELAASYFMKKLPKPLPFKKEKLDSTYLAFVGPTGSGKTSTLSKLALKYKREGCESIAIVAIDYDALHRQEILRHFAEENEIPFFLVTHESQLVQNMNKFSKYEVLLFDTEGCSPYDSERMLRLAKTCESLTPVQTALVLPTHLSSGDMKSIMKRFSVTHYDRLILTKLDETEKFGNLLQASCLSQVPLAYFTMGLRIPEDIEEATLERVMDCLFDFSKRVSNFEENLESQEISEEESEELQASQEEIIPADQIPVSVKSLPEGLTFL